MRHHGSLFIVTALTFGAAAAAYQGVLWVPDHNSTQFVVGVVVVACAGAAGTVYVLRYLFRLALSAVRSPDVHLHDRVHAVLAWRPAPSGRPAPGAGGRHRAGDAAWSTMRRRPAAGDPHTAVIPAVGADVPPREACADNDDLLMDWPRQDVDVHGSRPRVVLVGRVGAFERNGWTL